MSMIKNRLQVPHGSGARVEGCPQYTLNDATLQELLQEFQEPMVIEEHDDNSYQHPPCSLKVEVHEAEGESLNFPSNDDVNNAPTESKADLIPLGRMNLIMLNITHRIHGADHRAQPCDASRFAVRIVPGSCLVVSYNQHPLVAVYPPAEASTSWRNRDRWPLKNLLHDAFELEIAAVTICPHFGPLNLAMDVLLRPDWRLRTLDETALLSLVKQFLQPVFKNEIGTTVNFKQLFASLVPDKTIPVRPDVNPAAMTSILLPFQRRVVSWMMMREGTLGSEYDVLHPFWLGLGGKSYLNFNTMAVSDEPQMISARSDPGAFRGGILSEEVGLGKTVEMLALILNHPRPVPFVAENQQGLPPSGTTLIITPETIIQQWVSEIAHHAPTLSVLVVATTNKDEEVTTVDLMQYDIVLTTYIHLRKEFNIAQSDSQRSRRFERKYERKKSVFTGMEFWRVVVDEAQMIETQQSKTAEMAAMVPRVNSWAVTATPIGNSASSFQDMRGLFYFLDQSDMFAASLMHAPMFNRLIKMFMVRHSKEAVKDDLKLPPQHENIVYLDFEEIEQQLYKDQREEMAKVCAPILRRMGTDYQETDDVIHLRKWLLQLRQTCCHPQVGVHNRNQFGNTFRSIPQVLDTMYRKCLSDVHSHQRTILSTQVRRGLLHELRKEWQQAMDIYKSVLTEIEPHIADIRKQNEDTTLLQRKRKMEAAGLFDDDEDDESDVDGRLSMRSSLNNSLSMYHQMIFCYASVLLELGHKEEADEWFGEAETVRKELMKPMENKVLEVVDALERHQTTAELKTKLVANKLEMDFDKTLTGGMLSNEIIRQLEQTCVYVNQQINQIMKYRKRILEISHRPLHEGDYSKEAEIQELGSQYLDLYAEALSIRRSELLGIEVNKPRVKRARMTRTARNTTVTQSRLDAALAPLKSPIVETNTDVISDAAATSEVVKKEDELEIPDPLLIKIPYHLKDLLRALRSVQQRPGIPEAEQQLCQAKVDIISREMRAQVDILGLLDRESSEIGRLWNRRIEFYRMLQRLSDDVRIPEDVIDIETELNSVMDSETNSRQILGVLVGKRRYLEHLLDKSQRTDDVGGEQDEQKEDNICQICRGDLDDAKTVLVLKCGHIFCEACLQQWLKVRSRCPNCNSKVDRADITKATTKALSPEIGTATQLQLLSGNVSQVTARYPFPAPTNLPAIRGSFGSKISIILRHLQYLIQKEHGFKCLIFSQWDEVLDIIELGLKENKISSVRPSIGRPSDRADAPILFKQDPSIHVFLLNAKRHSAGLTLVCATHVFLVEPSINPAIELQAMGRVHRLGQTRETWVHRYIVRDSVEVDVLKLNKERVTKTMVADDEEDTKSLSYGVPPALATGTAGELVQESDLQVIICRDIERSGIQPTNNIDTEIADNALPAASGSNSAGGSRRKLTKPVRRGG